MQSTGGRSIDSLNQTKRLWYVVTDSEGVWLTQTPHEGDDILFESSDLSAAETQLCRLSGER